MESFPDRQGTEFDWFAVDKSGEVAVFASAGVGPVPSQGRAAAEDHDAIGEQIVVTGWGTKTVWESYARVGLFAYDWDDQRHCYSRVAQPDQPVNEGLSVRLAAIALPRLPLSFRTSPSIAADLAWL